MICMCGTCVACVCFLPVCLVGGTCVSGVCVCPLCLLGGVCCVCDLCAV